MNRNEFKNFKDLINWNVYNKQNNITDQKGTESISKNIPIGPQRKINNDKSSSFINSLKSILPSSPHGINIASGALSLAFPGEQAELVKNLPQVLAGKQPGISEKTEQFIGEMLPGIEGGGKAITSGVKGAQKGIQYLQPGKLAEEFRSTLGEGTTKENINLIGDMIKSSKEKAEKEGKALYDKIFKTDNIGNKEIYKTKTPSGIHQSSYRDMPQIKIKASGDLLDKLKLFNKNPTLQNAHELQSLLGSEIRSIKPIDIAAKQLRSSYIKAQKQIKNGINDFLERESPGLKNEYNEATNFWRENVIPYSKRGTIEKLGKGLSEEVTSSQLGSTFTKLTPHIKKILSDLGEKGSKKILYNALQKVKPGQSEDMAKAILDLKRTKGYDKYIDDKMINWANKTLKHVKKADLIKKSLASGGAGLVGSAMFGPLGGMIGMAAPWAGKGIKGAANLVKYMKK